MNQNSENQNQNHPELEPQMESAVWAVLGEPVPVDAIERVKQRARELNADSTPPAKESKTKRPFPAVLRLAIAASLLATVMGGMSLLGIFSSSNSSSLYAQVASKLEGIQSMICHVQYSPTASLEALQFREGHDVTFLAPSFHRIENNRYGTVEILDGLAADVVEANSPAKVVGALLDHIRVDRANDDGIRSLGTKIHDGVSVLGYESTIDGEVVRAWFDADSFVPVMVAVKFVIPENDVANGSEVATWQIMSEIQLNVEVDRDLFSTEPSDLETIDWGEFAVDDSPAELADVIKLLRRCAELNDGNFPVSLSLNDDPGTPMAIQKKFMASLEKQFNDSSEAQQAETVELVKQVSSVFGRSMAFQLSVQPENDWNYFGGAKLDQPERPILWFSPQADDNYTVVYADLTVSKVARAELPTKPVDVVQPEVPQAIERVIRVATPRFELPESTIRQYSKLQLIRASGRQSEIEYLSLSEMPEFLETQVKGYKPGVSVPAEDGRADRAPTMEGMDVDPAWKPNRSADSKRLAFLKEFRNLKGLDVGGLYLTLGDLEVIGNCSDLQFLSLSGANVFESESRPVTGDDLEKLSGLTSLGVLDLSQANFAGGLHHLKDLSYLHTVYLASFEHLDDASVAELSVLPELETLVLAPVYMVDSKATKNVVTEQGLKSLQDLPRIKTLYVGEHGEWTLPVDQLRELMPDVKVVSPTDDVE